MSATRAIWKTDGAGNALVVGGTSVHTSDFIERAFFRKWIAGEAGFTIIVGCAGVVGFRLGTAQEKDQWAKPCEAYHLCLQSVFWQSRIEPRVLTTLAWVDVGITIVTVAPDLSDRR